PLHVRSCLCSQKAYPSSSSPSSSTHLQKHGGVPSAINALDGAAEECYQKGAHYHERGRH
ncbi:MAG: hypothetical protein ACKPKO_32510, partial [Candidatus Fonsibacter sp.]